MNSMTGVRFEELVGNVDAVFGDGHVELFATAGDYFGGSGSTVITTRILGNLSAKNDLSTNPGG